MHNKVLIFRGQYKNHQIISFRSLLLVQRGKEQQVSFVQNLAFIPTPGRGGLGRGCSPTKPSAFVMNCLELIQQMIINKPILAETVGAQLRDTCSDYNNRNLVGNLTKYIAVQILQN